MCIRDRSELFSVPIGGGVATRLNAAGDAVFNFAISPDAGRVVYVGARPLVVGQDLYSVPIAGGPTIRLSDMSLTDGAIWKFAISPDAGHVVYLSLIHI